MHARVCLCVCVCVCVHTSLIENSVLVFVCVRPSKCVFLYVCVYTHHLLRTYP